MELKRGTLSRRGFLQRSVAGLVATGLPLWAAKEAVADEEQMQAQQQPVAPSDKIVMGHIGCGNDRMQAAGRGRDITRSALATGIPEYVAVCDVHRGHRQSFVAQVLGGRQVAQFHDFRDLLARTDIDAVSIATPDHWHAIIAIAAMRAGKDVYCEKPLTLTIDEGKAMVRVARETNRRLQTGSQQRTEFAGRFRTAVELVRNGRIGNVQTIECRIDGNPTGGPFPVVQPPEALDWDFWMGPTPRVDYVERKFLYDFRWFYEYSGGKMTDWGAHHLDTAQWALGMDQSGPVEVEGTGDAPDTRPNCFNCHPHFTATYRYANGTTVRAMSRGENGVHFAGEGGKWLFVSRGALRASDPSILAALPNNAIRLPTFGMNNQHMRNFFNCVKSRQQPICHVEVGHRSATVCHLGAIAIRTGWHLHWDPVNERFVGEHAAAANQWLSREYRAPWRLDA